MKAAADCALGAANLSIYGDGKISLKGLGDTKEARVSFCGGKVLNEWCCSVGVTAEWGSKDDCF